MQVVGWEGLYSVSSDGRVFSVRRRRVLTPGTNPRTGYLCVSLCRDGKSVCRTVHSLVLSAFHPRPSPYHECCHNNGVRTDNRLENLRWGTRAENSADRIAHGTVARLAGTRAPTHKLSAEDVRMIRSSDDTSRALAAKLGVSHHTILSCRNRITYKEEP
jgi:DNA-binding CsgD family transcriptional regulator